MKIEPEDIKSFQGLWKEQFGLDLNEQDAHVKVICLLEMMKAIYQPIPKPVEGEKQLSLLDFNQYSDAIQPIENQK